jgi:hypothetical protein
MGLNTQSIPAFVLYANHGKKSTFTKVNSAKYQKKFYGLMGHERL